MREFICNLKERYGWGGEIRVELGMERNEIVVEGGILICGVRMERGRNFRDMAYLVISEGITLVQQ